MSRMVHIVAVGARTPVGLNAESTAAALRAGIGRLREHPFETDAQGEPVCCTLDAVLPPERLGRDRLAALVHGALVEVATKLTRPPGPPPAPPLVLALPEARPGHTAEDSHAIARMLGTQPVAGLGTLAVELHASGHAAALAALEAGTRAVAEGTVELCLVAGVDSYHGAGTFRWLDAQRRLKRGGIRSGFHPGESAAVLALASDGERQRLGLPSLARVRGVATALEPGSLDSDEGLLGHGLTEAVRRACASLATPDELVDAVYCDINGERHRSDEWGFTLMRASELFRDATDYTSTVGELGDTGAATGALGCILAIQSWQRRHARGPRAVVWGSSWGGLRAAALLEEGSA